MDVRNRAVGYGEKERGVLKENKRLARGDNFKHFVVEKRARKPIFACHLAPSSQQNKNKKGKLEDKHPW